MKTRKNLKIRKIGNKYIVVEVCKGNANLTDVYSMNKTAAELWMQLQKNDMSKQELVEWMCKKYSISEAIAINDLNQQLEQWREMGLLI